MKKIVPVLAVMLLVAACSSDSGETTTSQADVADSTTTSPAEMTTTQTDTTTSVAPPETTTTEAPSIPLEPYVAGENADADALHDLYAVVFDSAGSYDEKAALIDDPSGLEETVEAYTAAGGQVGGIFLEVTATGIDGDTGAVAYDLLFAENPFQTDQRGPAVLVDGTWKVTREYFCEIMGLARVACS